MQRFADVVAVERVDNEGSKSTEVRADTGGDVTTADQALPPGVDAHPIPGIDAAVVGKAAGQGNSVVSGYVDTKNEQQSGPGEFRIYGRDPETGAVVCEFWLKNTGDISVRVLKAGASITIESDGPVIVNSPDIRLGDGGKPFARVGDLVAVVVPQLICAAPGAPAVPVPPTAVTPTGGTVAAGTIVSGKQSVTG